MKRITAVFAVFFALFLVPAAGAQDAPKAQAEDIEKARSEMLSRWGAGGLVKPGDTEAKAKEILGRPLAEQSEAELKKLAEQANIVANYVGFIFDEYRQYYGDNYRYDFVQTKVAPFHDAYLKLANRFKDYRNRAYFNLGKKAVERGDEVGAFFFFRDAYRLSTFTEEAGDHKGMRYLAEVEMKKLLGIDSINTFVYWK